MNKKHVLSPVLILFCTCLTCGAQIDKIPWNASNCAKLNSSDKTAVAAFVNGLGDSDPGTRLDPSRIGQFRWVDLAGDGRCELVMTVSTGPNYAALWVYWQDHFQAIAGGADLKEGIKDLNGDGKKEIVVYSYLDPAGGRAALGSTPVWPEVYRLQGERYVPASKDFPQLYDLEILPKLDKQIAKTLALQTGVAAALEMQRDKILRVLGRDPNAGLEKARYWATTDDPELIWDAVDVFRDIGGHEEELRAAEQAGKRAWQRWLASRPNR